MPWELEGKWVSGCAPGLGVAPTRSLWAMVTSSPLAFLNPYQRQFGFWPGDHEILHNIPYLTPGMGHILLMLSTDFYTPKSQILHF